MMSSLARKKRKFDSDPKKVNRRNEITDSGRDEFGSKRSRMADGMGKMQQSSAEKSDALHVDMIKRWKQEQRKGTVEDYQEYLEQSLDASGSSLMRAPERSDSESEEGDRDEVDKEEEPQQSNAGESFDVQNDNPKMKQLFATMGLSKDTPLGKMGQGRIEPVPLSTQKGRAGLGAVQSEVNRREFVDWDFSKEEKTVEEYPSWLECSDEVRQEAMAQQEEWKDEWMVVGKRKESIDDEDRFCDRKLLERMLQAKTVFDTLSDRELQQARTRANPYEAIKCGFFQNRAAMKAANLDRIYNWIFTRERDKDLVKKNPVDLDEQGMRRTGINTDRSEPLFYFADVCAGPGGFSEYVLWRKGFSNAKGFGFTLKGKDDFKLEKFTAASPAYFEPFYGVHGDGDVTKPDNIKSFETFVLEGTNEEGVHMMMADGGFSVEGKENIQEILSKRLYLCQFLVSLSIVRGGGSFFCKLFDIFTPFSIGLIYLMYLAFDKVSLHKPHTSRPANSERYIICDSLREDEALEVKRYLTAVNNKLDELAKENNNQDVNEVVPLEVIASDENFMTYIQEHNNRLLARQIVYLEKYKAFARDQGKIDLDQGNLRESCLRYWMLPMAEKRRREDRRESQISTLNRLSGNKVIDFDEFFKRRFPFEQGVAQIKPGDNIKRMRFAELRMCALSERTAPALMFSSEHGVFCRYPKAVIIDRVDLPPRLPKDSLLLVQRTNVFSGFDAKGSLTGKRAAFRILDAAVIGGDDVSSLSFVERMAAAEKMCKAVNLLRPEKSSCPIYVAKVFELDKLGCNRSLFQRQRSRDEDTAILEECEKRYIQCHGMRVVSILKDKCFMMWSTRQQNYYLFDKTGNTSFVLNDEHGRHCYADFWTTTIPKRNDKPGNEFYQWHWDWTQNFLEEDPYGPEAILGAESHPKWPTLKSLQQIADKALKEAKKQAI